MSYIFFKKNLFTKNTFWCFCIGFMLHFSGCKFGEIPTVSTCKVGAVNYSLLKYNAQNQIIEAELSAFLVVKYDYEAGNPNYLSRQNVYNNNILTEYTQHTWDVNRTAVRVSKYSKDSQGVFQESQRDTFFVNTQRQITKIKKSNGTYTRFEHENGNVARVYWYNGSQNESLFLRFTMYDNSKNPYYNSPLTMYMYDDTGDGFHFSKNNATQCTYYYTDGSVREVENLSHAYDNNNNPIKLQSPTGQFWYFSYVCN